MTQNTDQERAEFEKAWRERPIYMGGVHQKEVAYIWWTQAARRAPAVPVPSRRPTLEEIEEAVGYHSSGWDCVDPSELIDAIMNIAAAPQPPDVEQCQSCRTGSPYACTCTFKTERNSDPSCFKAAPVQLPEPQAEIEVRSMKTYLDLSIHEWRDTLPDGAYNIYTEQQLRQLLAAHGIGKDKQG